MRSTAPRREQLNRIQWFNDRRNAKDIFRLRLPKMSERNGPICCLRVIVVRMKEGQVRAKIIQPRQSKVIIQTNLTGPWGSSTPGNFANFIISSGASGAVRGRRRNRVGRLRG